MRARVAALTLAVAGLSLLGGPMAGAVDGGGAEGPVTANLTTTGTRSVTTVAPIVFSGALSSGLQAQYSVSVAEAARTGTNQWSVTARLCGPAAGNPLVSDCATRGDSLVSSAGTMGGAAVAVGGRSVTELLPGGSGLVSAPSGSEALDAQRTLFTNSGQSTAVAYTETYTAAGSLTLTPADGTPTGTYSGYLVVTLVQ